MPNKIKHTQIKNAGPFTSILSLSFIPLFTHEEIFNGTRGIIIMNLKLILNKKAPYNTETFIVIEE